MNSVKHIIDRKVSQANHSLATSYIGTNQSYIPKANLRTPLLFFHQELVQSLLIKFPHA